jgi:hypothetical protein
MRRRRRSSSGTAERCRRTQRPCARCPESGATPRARSRRSCSAAVPQSSMGM